MPGYSGSWQRLSQRVKSYYRAHPEHECVCWLCTYPIDVWLHHNHRWSFTLDHVLAVKDGGEDVIDNALPAHRACNTERRNRKVLHVKQTREW